MGAAADVGLIAPSDLSMAAIGRSLGAMRPTVEQGFLVDVEESDGEASILGSHQAERQEIQCPIQRNVIY